MKIALAFALLLAALPAAAESVFPDKFLFTKPVYVCQTAAEYVEVTTNGGNAADLQCVHISVGANDDILAPWVEILEEKNGLATVRFIIEDYTRLRPKGGRGGRAVRTLYIGWTDPANLESVTTF